MNLIRSINMRKTVCELFAGVGGFRCGLNHIRSLDDLKKPEKWNTVWFNQYEPSEKKTQYAHDCYIYHFGTVKDLNNNDTTNMNIEDVDKSVIPDFNLLVGGFPCQDYSVASTLSSSKGLDGKKGVLWWQIRDVLEVKQPSFVLLENVDRLLKSPAVQRGRDFGIILACFRDLGYTVEWRIINAADYGYQQRRRRIFIFAYKNNTKYAKSFFNAFTSRLDVFRMLVETGFFVSVFPVAHKTSKEKYTELSETIGEISSSFEFDFENTGLMRNGEIFTLKTEPDYNGKYIMLGDIMETDIVDNKYFIDEKDLYYTNSVVTHCDETVIELSKEERHTWQYIKGAKKILRKSKTGHAYIYSEGAMPMIDEYNKPARTLLTSEGSFSRTTHIVRDRMADKIRFLTPAETERIQGFPIDFTKYCKLMDDVILIPDKKRYFMMGNALVVNLIENIEVKLSRIFDNE